MKDRQLALPSTGHPPYSPAADAEPHPPLAIQHCSARPELRLSDSQIKMEQCEIP